MLIFKKIKQRVAQAFLPLQRQVETQSILIGRQLGEQLIKKEKIENLSEVEFKIFSQFGDDGIIQYLIKKLAISTPIFIEFGVENYQESNTRFLLMNNNWSGMVMDGSAEHISYIQRQEYYWRNNLKAVEAFVTRDNINNLLTENGISGEIGILSIDIDGNDYWVWEKLTAVNPIIVIAEYNSVFGGDQPITIPYDENFIRGKAHFSHLYWGASLPALCHLAETKGYCFIGSNSAGNNAYFIRKDKIGNLKPISAKDGYVDSQIRDSRDENGNLNYKTGSDRLAAIKGMPVINVKNNQLEKL